MSPDDASKTMTTGREPTSLSDGDAMSHSIEPTEDGFLFLDAVRGWRVTLAPYSTAEDSPPYLVHFEVFNHPPMDLDGAKAEMEQSARAGYPFEGTAERVMELANASVLSGFVRFDSVYLQGHRGVPSINKVMLPLLPVLIERGMALIPCSDG